LIEAAVSASVETDAAIEVHTERGADAEAITRFMLDSGMRPHKLVLCHMDKRAEFGLHRDLAAAGVRLEYDTFVRPKYHPDDNVWALLPQMIAAGFAKNLVLATDLADATMWHHLGDGPGAVSFFTHIQDRLHSMGVEPAVIRQLVGGNIVRALAR
jgi:phosphotriesterase-related protein